MTATRWSGQDVYAEALDAWASSAGVPRALAYAIVAQESGFNPRAFRAEPTYRCALTGETGDGSYGLTQILYCTAYGMGFRGQRPELFEVDTNLQLGMRFLGQALRARGGNVWDAVSQYNGGYRPSIGFGGKLATGRYNNQSYVDGVREKMDYFQQYLAERDGVPATPIPADDASTDVTPSASSVTPWLVGLGAAGLFGWLLKRVFG